MILNTPLSANKRLTVVNMFPGPGVGKSVLCAETFSLLKKSNIECEVVTEFAKDLVWDQRYNMFIEQDVILAEQYWRLRRLAMHDIKVAITDTSLLLGFVYAPSDYYLTFFEHMKALYDSFTNINIFLKRGSFEYQEKGRNETVNEAIQKDRDALQWIFVNHKLPFYLLTAGDEKNPAIIRDIVLGKSNQCLLSTETSSKSDLETLIFGKRS